MRVYFADLVHNCLQGLNSVPLNVGCIAAVQKDCFGSEIDIRLFKYCDKLFDAIEEAPPQILALSNYTWNEALNEFVCGWVAKHYPEIIIVFGGPNIRIDRKGIQEFLKKYSFVDTYVVFDGELPFKTLMERFLKLYPLGMLTHPDVREQGGKYSFSLWNEKLRGEYGDSLPMDIDSFVSPYLTGLLDEFLTPEFMPIFETNRGCPYSCAYCVWGVKSRKSIRKYSLDRVFAEMSYVCGRKVTFPQWFIADANFGILDRDIEIARFLRDIYEKEKPFHNIQICWDKNTKNDIVEIAKILSGISHPYIAYQTFDPDVEKLIKRKNIPLEELSAVSTQLKANSERFHTDLLVGLPGETYKSQIKSLKKALEVGFDSIGGGEIRLLKGSELESDKSRKKFGLRTKYRLVQEGFGIYRGNFIIELEESIRATNWITEAEMIRLRVLRAIFYAAITIGEFDILSKYLQQSGISIVDILENMIDGYAYMPEFKESLEWLYSKARHEWFESKEAALEYFRVEEHRSALMEYSIVKLNYDFLTYIMLDDERYEGFYNAVESATLDILKEKKNKPLLREILAFCRAKNYIRRCLAGHTETMCGIDISEEFLTLLVEVMYLDQAFKKDKGTVLSIDRGIAKHIQTAVNKAKRKIHPISLVCQQVPIYMRLKNPEK